MRIVVTDYKLSLGKRKALSRYLTILNLRRRFQEFSTMFKNGAHYV